METTNSEPRTFWSEESRGGLVSFLFRLSSSSFCAYLVFGGSELGLIPFLNEISSRWPLPFSGPKVLVELIGIFSKPGGLSSSRPENLNSYQSLLLGAHTLLMKSTRHWAPNIFLGPSDFKSFKI